MKRQVAIVNPKSRIKEKLKPVALDLSELKVGVNRETEKDLDALKDILYQKLGRAASLSDVVAWMAKECRKKFDFTQSKIISSGNRQPKPGRHSIPISVRKIVYRRDQGQCTHRDDDRHLHKGPCQ
ncbi:MAG: hypothetical protein HYR96_07010 [Deltaproteobacteria bacterium]|nr:hypothetical protein [Deltaproteobacteria bacterium]MBI3295349.1 hypothetical protein [Deltaproteobacteria bacterium]